MTTTVIRRRDLIGDLVLSAGTAMFFAGIYLFLFCGTDRARGAIGAAVWVMGVILALVVARLIRYGRRS